LREWSQRLSDQRFLGVVKRQMNARLMISSREQVNAPLLAKFGSAGFLGFFSTMLLMRPI
jgi:hypothetical protein